MLQQQINLYNLPTIPKGRKDFWQVIYILRGRLFKGCPISVLLSEGYSEQEILTADTLNKKYFSRKIVDKLSEVGTFVFVG